MKLIKWIDRKFNFNFPPDIYPAILERLIGTPVRLEKMLKGIDKSVLTKRDGSAWSAQEHAGHLTDLEELHEKRLDQFIANLRVLSPADMSNKKTNLAHHNEKDIKEVLSEFKEARAAFIKKLESTDETVLTRVAIHPRLNTEMRLIDMLYFMAEHDDHHLAIIRSLINK